MKITETIISIPPYISTTWDTVVSMRVEENILQITLKDGKTVSIPNLTADVLEHLFSLHATFLENATKKPSQELHFSSDPNQQSPLEQLLTVPLHMNVSALDSMGQALQHNPAHAELPALPEEAAKKIASLAKIISEDDILSMPEAEKNCNCMYCQINRILRHAILRDGDEGQSIPSTEDKEFEEEISDEELFFSDWKIEWISDKMYHVTNKLDVHEQYTVHLGEPIGCTCGRVNCEHIVAVLRSSV